jgi:hypothetical protein
MKKEKFVFLITVFVLFFIVSGCNKTVPAEPAHQPSNTTTATITMTHTITESYTSTPTFTMTATVTPTGTSTSTPTYTPTYTATPTATSTITPDAGSMIYEFEGSSVLNWVIGAPAPATLGLATSALQFYNGSQSLAVSCAYSADNDLVRIKRSFEGVPVNLSGKAVTFWVYISPVMFGQGTFHPELSLTNYAGTTFNFTSVDFAASGWVQASWSSGANEVLEMIKEVSLAIRDDSAGSYNGVLYFDDINW